MVILHRNGSVWDRNERIRQNDNWETIEQGLERMESVVSESQSILDEAQQTNDMNKSVQQQINTLITESGTSDAEVLQARIDAKGNEYTVLKDRLDESDSQLEQTEQEISKVSKGFNRKSPVMTIISDDGDKEDYTKLKPLLDSKGITASVAIIPTRLGKSYAMSLSEVKELEEAGWSIEAHAEPDLTSISLSEAEFELKNNKELLEAEGFKPKTFIYPLGGFNDDVMLLAKQYYDYSFTTRNGVNTGVLASQKLDRNSVESNTEQQLKDRIDEAIQNNGWVILYTHGYSMDDAYMTKLENVIDYAQTTNIEILNVSDALKRVGNLIDLGVYNDITKRDEYFTVSSEGEVEFYDKQYLRFFLERPNGRDVNSPIDAFRENAVTEISFNSTDNGGFPTDAGTLQTHRTYGGESKINFQLWFTTSTNELYKRIEYASGNWQSWQKVNEINSHVVDTERNSFTANDPITSFPKNKITTFYFNSSISEGFPVIAGVVTTYRMNEDNWSRQELRAYKSHEVYSRYWDSGWTAWQKISSV